MGLIGVVVLNYMNIDVTKEMIASLHGYYPGIRTVVVDNGTPTRLMNDLQNEIRLYKNVTLLPLKSNRGYPKGMNVGINLLRKEGYNYICCSNSDIIFKEQGLLEYLKEVMDLKGAAIVGPAIINLKGDNQNPHIIRRPDDKKAKTIINNYISLSSKLKRIIPSKIWAFISYIKKYIFYLLGIKKNNCPTEADNNEKFDLKEEENYVYALHGSFVLFGPIYFRHYQGFDDFTFLYSEEEIIAEMLLLKGLKAVYASKKSVLHKQKESTKFLTANNYINENKLGKKKFKYLTDSKKYWYYNYYINYKPDKQ